MRNGNNGAVHISRSYKEIKQIVYEEGQEYLNTERL